MDIATMKPTKDITIIGKTVDRKASKKLMAKHEDFYTVTETMCKAMTLESWLDTAKTIYLEHDAGNISVKASAVRSAGHHTAPNTIKGCWSFSKWQLSSQ